MKQPKAQQLKTDWQLMLRCITNTVWLDYRCEWPADKKSFRFLNRRGGQAGVSHQIMPAPREAMNDHPFWEWYLEKRPQFWSHVEDAALALAIEYVIWNNKQIAAAKRKRRVMN